MGPFCGGRGAFHGRGGDALTECVCRDDGPTGSTADAEPVVDVLYVPFDRPHTEGQPFGDLAIVEAVGYERRYLALSSGSGVWTVTPLSSATVRSIGG